MKSVNYYIGDMHLGHTGVINMDGRPFESIEEMDKALIDNWNKRVTNKDTVYIIGRVIGTVDQYKDLASQDDVEKFKRIHDGL